jgi:hypothetical protein
VEKTMRSLYTFPRRLFWRRWQQKLSKLWQHFFFDLVRELLFKITILKPGTVHYNPYTSQVIFTWKTIKICNICPLSDLASKERL